MSGPPQRRWAQHSMLAAAFVTVVALAAGVGVAASLAHGTARSGSSPITGVIRVNPRRVASGGMISGALVFDNRTSAAKVLLRGCKFDELYDFALRASDGYSQVPASGGVACVLEHTLTAKPGVTTYPFRLAATYTHCLQSHQPPRNSKEWAPLCLRDSAGVRDIMPALPAGRYTILFVPEAPWHGPHVKSNEVFIG